MICPRCLLQAARAPALRTSALLTPVLPSTLRHLSTTRAPLSPETASTNPPAATSTSAAQPFSAGTAPAIATKDLTPVSATPAITSSVAAGTVLRGLNYFKNKPDPVALEDAAYPAWLWEVLAEKKSAVNEGAPQLDPRLFSKSAKARRVASKKMRAQAAANPDALVPRVPLHEQSVDLAPGPEAREELTRAMRARRRKGIKEANFLKSMS